MTGRSLLGLLVVLALVAAAGVAVWQWQERTGGVGSQSVESLARSLNELREVLAPEPLRGPLGGQGGPLSIAGVVRETNRHRAEGGLPALTGNTTLNAAAANKLNDMFARQYFAHEAPTGEGPGEVVDAVAYEYIRVGENLALGNFADDAALVQAWMDSPGHRANILHSGFSELGVAVGQGTFEGQQTWLAVQTFALPLSACPGVDVSLQRLFDQQKVGFEDLNDELATRQAELDADRAELEALAREIDRLIQEGNEEIEEGNRIAREEGDQERAQEHWDRGEALHEQARVKQAEYERLAAAFEQARQQFNEQVSAQQQQNNELQSLAARLNAQVRAFNACLKQ